MVVNPDAKNVGLEPPVLRFIASNIESFGVRQLELLAERLELAVITDKNLPKSTDEFPQKDQSFRNEVMMMAILCRIRLGQCSVMDRADNEFSDWVKGIEGAMIDSVDIYTTVINAIASPNANRDDIAFKLAIGRVIAYMSWKRIHGTYRMIRSESSDQVMAKRLGVILTNAAHSCVFAKIGTS